MQTRLKLLCLLWLAGSPSLSAAPSYTLGFGRIEVDLMLDASPNPSPAFAQFFNNAAENVVPGVGGLLDSSLNIQGFSPVTGDIYPQACGLASPLFTYPFANPTPLQTQGAMQPTPNGPYSGHFVLAPSTYQDTDPVTQLPLTPGVVDDGCIPHWIQLRHDLAGGRKHFYAESFRSDMLLPYDVQNGFPVDSRTILDPVGALRVRVHCGQALLNAQSAFITATLNPPITLPSCQPPYPNRPGSAGTLQASVNSAGPGPMDETFLVRAGRSYVVTVLFTVTSSGQPVTGQYSSLPTPLITQGDIVNVDITVDDLFCDFGQGCLSTIGRVEVIGANLFNDCFPPYVHIQDGPFSNLRIALMSQNSPGSPGGTYRLEDVVPSVAEFPATYPTRGYVPLADFYFKTKIGTFEYMRLFGGRTNLDCRSPVDDLGDLFVLNPGFLTGAVRLRGPDCGPGPSCLELISLQEGNTACSSIVGGYSSYVGGPRIDYAGPDPDLAFATIKGAATSPTTWLGNYSLSLAALNLGPVSVWNANGLGLAVRNPDYPNTVALWGLIRIADRLMSGALNQPVTINAGQTTVNDHNYCFSEITLTLVNPNSVVEIVSPKVDSEGSYGQKTLLDVPQPDPTGVSAFASYSAFARFYGTPTSYQPGNGQVRFCLPAGDHTITPSTDYRLTTDGSVGRTEFPPFALNVRCGDCVNIEEGLNGISPMIKLTNDTRCAALPHALVQGAICADTNRVLTNVSYVLNGGAPVVLCSGASCGAIYSLNIPVGPLLPCANTVTLTARDDNGLSSSTTFTIMRDSTPPVFTNCPPLLDLGCNPASIPDCGSDVGATDDCGAPIVTCAQVDTTNGCARTRTLTYVAVDACGNSSTCTQLITWTEDTTPPVLTCPSNALALSGPPDTWTASTPSPLAPRFEHSAVWAPTVGEVIVWGGFDGTTYFNDGTRFNPVTGIWTPMNATLNPSPLAPRYRHSAAWLPAPINRMFVWGGFGGTYFSDGALYDPATDSWTSITIANAPSGRIYQTAVLSDSEVLVWGGENFNGRLDTGARYDPSTDTWTPIPVTANTPSPRQYHEAAWATTTGEMIIWGGLDSSTPPVALGDGARFDPTVGPAGTWTPITPSATTPAARYQFASAWDGTEMLVWGGAGNNVNHNTGARYNPATGIWTPMTTVNAPAARHLPVSVWTGFGMIVWGGGLGGTGFDTGGCYDPVADTWAALSTTPAPTGRYFDRAVWTGGKMIVTDGRPTPDNPIYGVFNDTWCYAPGVKPVDLGCNPTNVPDCDLSISATDNCSVPTVTCAKVDTTNGCVRTRTLTYSAVDACGNSNVCRQLITWTEDLTPPVIICPTNFSVICTNPAGAVVEYIAAATDLCDTNVPVVCAPPAGSLFPKGETTVRCAAADTCGNSNTCAFTVTVTCCAGILSEQVGCDTNGSGCFTYTFTLQNLTTDDVSFVVLVPLNPQTMLPDLNCLSVTPAYFYLNPPLAPGASVTLTATLKPLANCGTNVCLLVSLHTETFAECCSFTRCLTLDAEPPQVTCAPDKIVECPAPPNFDSPTAWDACCGTNVTLTVVSNVSPPGNTCTNSFTRVWRVSDCAFNSLLCTQTVTVVDSTAPVVTCASNKTVACGVAWTFDEPTANDACWGTNVTFSVLGTVTNGACPQIITRTWQAADPCGNAATCSQTVTNPPCCVSPPPGLVLWLPLDETSGTTAANFAGGNNGMHVNGPVYNPGSYNANSLCFNAANDAVSVPFYPALGFGTGDFSVDAWVKPSTFDSTIRVIVDHRGQSANGIFGFSLYLWFGNAIGLQLADGTFLNYNSGVSVPADGQWHLVAVTVKRNSTTGITFYLDGVAVAQADATLRPGSITPPAGVPLRVGGHAFPQNQSFAGCLDEVEVFNRELTPAEVAGLYHACRAGKCKDCDSYPPLAMTCPTNQTHFTCNASVVANYNVITAGGGPPVTVTCTPPSGAAFPVGTNVVTCTATDRCGASADCSFTVTVRPTPPQLCQPIGIALHGGVINITIPAGMGDFTLQQTTTLNGTITEWNNVTDGARTTNPDGSITIRIPTDGSGRMFRVFLEGNFIPPDG